MSQRDREVLYKATVNAATKLSISDSDLNKIIGCNMRRINKSTLSEKETEKALLLIKLSIKTHCMFDGDAGHIQLWLTEYNTGINAVPIEEIKRDDGLRKVIDYLDSVSMH